MLRNFIITIFSSFLLLTNVNAEETTVFDFTDEEFNTLKVGKKYKGETTWTLGSNEKGNFINNDSTLVDNKEPVDTSNNFENEVVSAMQRPPQSQKEPIIKEIVKNWRKLFMNKLKLLLLM